MARFVDLIRLHRGETIPIVSMQVTNPGAVATYFMSDEQLIDLFHQTYVVLMRAGYEDPIQLLRPLEGI